MDPIGIVEGGGLADLAALNAQAPQAERHYAELYKALSAGYGTDHAGLAGGAALRRESLEASLLVQTQKLKHLVFWHKLPTRKAISTIDEFSIETGLGGVPGSSANAELGDIAESTGEIERRVAKVKYLMDRRSVSDVAQDQSLNGLQAAIAGETDRGSRKLLTDANYLAWYGDSDCVDVEFDGYFKQMLAVGGDNVVDLKGGSFNGNARELIDGSALVWGQGAWGQATDYFASPLMQADFDQKLDPAMRVPLDRDIKMKVGQPVRGVRTSYGDIAANIDPFIIEGQAPYIARGTAYVALLTGVTAPSAVDAVAAANANSRFTNAQAGNYYFGAEGGIGAGKRSNLVKSAQVGIAGGDGATVTVTHGVGGTAPTFFQLYRSRQDGTNANNDFREMCKVKAGSGGGADGTTVYVDLNQAIPGTSFVALTTIMDDAITMVRLGDQKRFPLYPTTRAEWLWAQILRVYLRIAKPQQHVLLINALPGGAKWKPFTA